MVESLRIGENPIAMNPLEGQEGDGRVAPKSKQHALGLLMFIMSLIGLGFVFSYPTVGILRIIVATFYLTPLPFVVESLSKVSTGD
jgi:hypothetical protein